MAPKSTVHTLAQSLLSVGSEIRQLRKARQMTLKALSQSSGVSLSHLSAIERGAAQPSMDVLGNVADALSVTPDWFFARRSGAGPMEQACVVRAQNRRSLNSLYQQDVRELGYTDALLSSSIGGDFYMGMTVYEPGSDSYEDAMLKHMGEIHAFLIDGTLQVRLAEEEITLHAGDSYSCDASIPHRAVNRSDRPARLIWAISPVVIPKDVQDSQGDADSSAKAKR